MIPKDSIKLTNPVQLSYGRVLGTLKPTPFSYNKATGFSMPIFNSDDEELFYTVKWRERWDGVTNPHMLLYVALTSAEDVGDKFKFELAGNSVDFYAGTVLPATSNTYYDEITIETGRNTQYATYVVDIEITASNIPNAGSISQGTIRRVASSGTEITGEIAVLHAVMEIKRDKIGAIYNH